MYIETFGSLASNTDDPELLLIALSFVAVMCVVMLKGEMPKSRTSENTVAEEKQLFPNAVFYVSMYLPSNTQ